MDELVREFFNGAAGLWELAVEFAVWSIAAVLVIAALLRVMPRERARPWRAGFFVLAPLVACVALAAGALAALASFLLTVAGVMFLGDRLLGRV